MCVSSLLCSSSYTPSSGCRWDPKSFKSLCCSLINVTLHATFTSEISSPLLLQSSHFRLLILDSLRMTTVICKKHWLFYTGRWCFSIWKLHSLYEKEVIVPVLWTDLIFKFDCSLKDEQAILCWKWWRLPSSRLALHCKSMLIVSCKTEEATSSVSHVINCSLGTPTANSTFASSFSVKHFWTSFCNLSSIFYSMIWIVSILESWLKLSFIYIMWHVVLKVWGQ